MNRSTLQSALIVLVETRRYYDSAVPTSGIQSAIADIQDALDNWDDSIDIKTLELREN